MSFLRWDHLTRDELASIAPEAVLVLPVGATEQHGPHLPTATDALLATTVAERACAVASAGTTVVLAPAQSYGASDHHLPIGATLSLTTETLRAVLVELLRSAAAAGIRRALLVNGHGGNAPTCAVAAADAARESGMTVAMTSYWELIPPPDGAPCPGHAGSFETSLMLAVAPDLVRMDLARPSPAERPLAARGVRVVDPRMWERLDGFTDDPTQANRERAEAWLGECVQALADVIGEIGTNRQD